MHVEIVGAGVIGSAFGRALLGKGHSVHWVDCDPDRVRGLRTQGIEASMPHEPAEPVSLYFICVPTPTKGNDQDRAALAEALVRVSSLLRPEILPTIVIRSTMLPGTSRRWAIPFVERASGLRHGTQFRLVCLPEFLREKRAEADALAPRIHLLGELEPGHGDAVADLLMCLGAPVTRVSLEAAELQKYVHNAFNALKITFFNEMRRVAAGMNPPGDAEAIFSVTCQSAEGMWNPSYGTLDLGPVSGKCLPKDVDALRGWLRSHDLDAPLLEALAGSLEKKNRSSDRS